MKKAITLLAVVGLAASTPCFHSIDKDGNPVVRCLGLMQPKDKEQKKPISIQKQMDDDTDNELLSFPIPASLLERKPIIKATAADDDFQDNNLAMCNKVLDKDGNPKLDKDGKPIVYCLGIAPRKTDKKEEKKPISIQKQMDDDTDNELSFSIPASLLERKPIIKAAAADDDFQDNNLAMCNKVLDKDGNPKLDKDGKPIVYCLGLMRPKEKITVDNHKEKEEKKPIRIQKQMDDEFFTARNRNQTETVKPQKNSASTLEHLKDLLKEKKDSLKNTPKLVVQKEKETTKNATVHLKNEVKEATKPVAAKKEFLSMF